MDNEQPDSSGALATDGTFWVPPPWGFGSCSQIVDHEAPRDRVAELHAVVAEITGRPVKAMPRRRIGFV